MPKSCRTNLALVTDSSKINATCFCCAPFFLQNLPYVKDTFAKDCYNLNLFWQRLMQRTQQRSQFTHRIGNFESSCVAQQIDWLSKHLWHWLFRVLRLCWALLIARGIMWYLLAQRCGSSSHCPWLEAMIYQYKDRLWNYVSNDLQCARGFSLRKG